MTVIFGLCSFWIDWLSFGKGRGGVHLKSSQRVGRILDVDGQEGGGSWKLYNFHGHHMCIIPKLDMPMDMPCKCQSNWNQQN